MNLGENIYKYRTQRNMSQGDLADALDVSRQSVSKWENNNAVPELDKTVKMAELFGITIDELVAGRKPEPVIVTVPAPAAPAPKTVTIRLVLGIFFFATAGITVIFSIFFAHSLAFYISEGFLLALEFILAGLMCLFPKSWDAHSLCWYASILMFPFTVYFDFITYWGFVLSPQNIILLIACRLWRKRLDTGN